MHVIFTQRPGEKKKKGLFFPNMGAIDSAIVKIYLLVTFFVSKYNPFIINV